MGRWRSDRLRSPAASVSGAMQASAGIGGIGGGSPSKHRPHRSLSSGGKRGDRETDVKDREDDREGLPRLGQVGRAEDGVEAPKVQLDGLMPAPKQRHPGYVGSRNEGLSWRAVTGRWRTMEDGGSRVDA